MPGPIYRHISVRWFPWNLLISGLLPRPSPHLSNSSFCRSAPRAAAARFVVAPCHRLPLPARRPAPALISLISLISFIDFLRGRSLQTPLYTSSDLDGTSSHSAYIPLHQASHDTACIVQETTVCI